MSGNAARTTVLHVGDGRRHYIAANARREKRRASEIDNDVTGRELLRRRFMNIIIFKEPACIMSPRIRIGFGTHRS